MWNPLRFTRRHLDEVFTTGPRPNDLTYVDRAHLDERLAAADRGGKHVAIHGESKHGKTWLRSKLLREDACARTQCIPGMTAEEAISSTLGRMGVNERVKLTGTHLSETKLGGGAEIGAGGAQVSAGADIRDAESSTVEERPVGQDPKDLGWVAEQFRERSRRPVFEDFHNLAPSEQRKMAFAIKALGDWDVPCVVAGIWPDHPLLTYYNGELDGRIEDLHVRWTGSELAEIVRKGSSALNVEISEEILQAMVRDAHTSAGLMQELARQVLWDAGVRRRRFRKLRITDMDRYRRSRETVAHRIAARFNPFVDNLYRYEPPGLRPRAYGHLLLIVTDRFSDADLLEGVAVTRVVTEITIVDADMTREQLLEVLEHLPEAHRLNEIHPLVLAYDRAGDRLVLVDRRFLLYRRRYARRWPWEEP